VQETETLHLEIPNTRARPRKAHKCQARLLKAVQHKIHSHSLSKHRTQARNQDQRTQT
jgi:hypothetical protein